ncbi:MAG TPA: hypothetical protein PLX23_09005 [Candidatus Hydrogenedens sp.]|nr:hypothetical protein [Candidatus Hydrogenedens sp.]
MSDDLSKKECHLLIENENISVIQTERKFFFYFILICTALLAYANTLDNDWVWDDVSSVLIHKHVQDPKEFFQLFLEDQHAFGRGQGNFYRPLVSVSFMIDYLLSFKSIDVTNTSEIPNISPLVFHITNSLWHACVVLLIFILLNKLKVPLFVSFWTSLVYCVHPISTEAVAYISGRADMMSTAFMLAGIIICIKYVAEENTVKEYLYLIACPLFFVMGLLSKESAYIFPILLTLVLFFISIDKDLQSSKKEGILKKWIPLFLSIIVAIIYIVFRLTVLNFSENTATIIKTWSEKIVEVGQSFAFYIRVLFFPVRLHMEQTLENTPYWTALFGYVFLLALLFVVYWAWKSKNKRLFISVAWFLITWFPISGFFTLNAPQAEHWMYAPMIGFWWCIFELIHYLIQHKQLLQIDKKYLIYSINLLLLVITTVYFFATYLRNEEWKNNETIFKSTLIYNPNTVRVRYNLAVTYEDILKNYPGAKREYQKLIQYYERIKKKEKVSEKQILFINEEEIEIWLSCGKTLFSMGKFVEAIEQLTPVSFLVKQKEFLPYGIESLWYIAQSYLSLGNIQIYQIISSQIQNVSEEIFFKTKEIMLGKELPIPSYLTVESELK